MMLRIRSIVAQAIVATALVVGVFGVGKASTPTNQVASIPPGFELDYYHADHASKTYAIRLKNGLRATLDFRLGSATLYANGQQATYPLQQVLLQLNNGDSNAADKLYDRMNKAINEVDADTVVARIAPMGQGIACALPPLPRNSDRIELPIERLWATPQPGGCWPLPNPCVEQPGGLTQWGRYNHWLSDWLDKNNDRPAPRPDGCMPGDVDCIVYEHDRKKACDDAVQNDVTTYGSAVTAGYACGSALGTGGGLGVTAAACLVAFSEMAVAQSKRLDDTEMCRTPYPG